MREEPDTPGSKSFLINDVVELGTMQRLDPHTMSWFRLGFTMRRYSCVQFDARFVHAKKGDGMLLKVGELAKRTGITVRMLHHYDSIGLLVPSSRTDADYRLYNRADIARLHAIQALRQLGLPLKEIAGLMKGKLEPLPLIIQRQINSLENQIEQAGELCGRLRLLQSSLSDGNEPDIEDWLSMLSSMSTYGKYFTASELRKIFEYGKPTEARWAPLVAAVRDAMRCGASPLALEIQPLARRWMDLSVLMMQGDFELMKRWEKMYLQEPAARGRVGDDLDLVLYINRAVDLRVKAFLKYFSQDELQRLDFKLESEWLALALEIKKIMQEHPASSGRKTRAVVKQWDGLIDRVCNHDSILRKKFVEAHGCDAVLQAGSILGPELERFIRDASIARAGK